LAATQPEPFPFTPRWRARSTNRSVPRLAANTETIMNSIIYIVGLIVVVLVILSFLGLR
jgi:hypothetical protein